MAKRPTIQMVADRAGVSRGTVDRVVHNRAPVKEEVRQRVLDAAAELGYMTPYDQQRQAFGADRAWAPLRLGVLIPNWSDYFRPEILQGVAGASEELKAFRVEVETEECLTDSPDEVIRRLDAMAKRGIQGISLCTINHPLVEDKVTELVEQGIPVITFNSDLPNSRRLSFVGQNYVKSGRTAAELLYRCVHGEGPVLATIGNRDFNGHQKRLTGFLQRMEELHFPREQIIMEETFNDYYVTTRKVTETLQAHPELKGIYMGNNSVMGCAHAIETAGKRGIVHLVIHDYWEGARDLLHSGLVDFTITQDFYRQGYLPLKCLREYLQLNQQPEPDLTNTRFYIICSQNAD